MDSPIARLIILSNINFRNAAVSVFNLAGIENGDSLRFSIPAFLVVIRAPFGVVEVCVYVYPTFESRFFDQRFSTLDILGPDRRFPIGVAVGDSEQHVLDVLGPPPFHHMTENWFAWYEFFPQKPAGRN